MTDNTAQETAISARRSKRSRGIRRWMGPRVFGIAAVALGSLALSTTASATSAASQVGSDAVPNSTLVVYTSDAGQNVVVLTPSGGLLILVRDVVQTLTVQPTPVATVSVVVTRTVAVTPIKDAHVAPVVEHVVWKSLDSTTIRHRGFWRVESAGWWSGNPNGVWRPYRRCDPQNWASRPQVQQTASWSNDPHSPCSHSGGARWGA